MSEDGGSSVSNPGVDDPKTPEQAPMQRDAPNPIQQEPSSQPSTDDSPLSDVLPDDSDSDGDGRTGVLSTRTEVHAAVIGVTAGAHFGLNGDAQLINDVVGIGLAGDRARQAKRLPEKFIEQAKEELPYFLVGVAIGFAGARTDALAGLNLGV